MPIGKIKKLPGQKQPVNEWQDSKAIKPGGDDAWEIQLGGDDDKRKKR